jgi:hypothetical protein
MGDERSLWRVSFAWIVGFVQAIDTQLVALIDHVFFRCATSINTISHLCLFFVRCCYTKIIMR